MQDRPAYAISPSRFPFPVLPPLNKPSSGQCVEPTIAQPYLYRDPGILHDAPEANLVREGGEGAVWIRFGMWRVCGREVSERWTVSGRWWMVDGVLFGSLVCGREQGEGLYIPY